MNSIKELRKQHDKFVNDLESKADLWYGILQLEKFNYSDNEINLIEKLYKENFNNPEKLHTSLDNLREAFFAYCYMAFKRSNGGELRLDENKRSVSFGKSIIVNYGGEGYPWVAISIDAWIKRLEEDRFKGRLSETINRNLKDQIA